MARMMKLQSRTNHKHGAGTEIIEVWQVSAETAKAMMPLLEASQNCEQWDGESTYALSDIRNENERWVLEFVAPTLDLINGNSYADMIAVFDDVDFSWSETAQQKQERGLKWTS